MSIGLTTFLLLAAYLSAAATADRIPAPVSTDEQFCIYVQQGLVSMPTLIQPLQASPHASSARSRRRISSRPRKVLTLPTTAARAAAMSTGGLLPPKTQSWDLNG